MNQDVKQEKKMKVKITIGRVLYLMMFCIIMAKVAEPETSLADGQVFRLGEVVVTEEKEAVSLATTVTEVSMKEIEAKGAKSVADALRFLPGVLVQSGGKGEVHVSIRGFEQNQVKVLIDGVPARENYFGTVDLSMLPADIISKITITKGASSVLYGSNTMGGVINIVTKKGSATPFTSFSTSFGDYATSNYSLSHGGSSGAINYWISGGYQESDGFRLSGDFDVNDPDVGVGTQFNEDGGKRDLSDYTKKNLDMKVGYDPGGDSSVYLSFDYVNNERGMPTFYSRYWEYSDWEQWQVNLVGEYRFTDAVKVKTRLFYVKHNDGITDVSWDEEHTTSGKKWFEESYYHDTSIGGEVQTSLKLTDWNTLRFAVNYMEDDHKEANYLSDDCWNVIKGSASIGWTDEDKYKSHTYTIAVEDELSLNDRISMVAGVSYDAFEPTQTSDQPEPDQMDTINPQVGIVFDMTDTTALHASVGQKTRFPGLKELYSTLSGGNPDLDPEKTVAYEVGASHVFSSDLKGNIAFFYHDIEDLIDMIKIDGQNAYININEATIYGAEATLDMKLSSALNTAFNYTWLQTVDKSNNDRELEGRPRHRINLTMSYCFPFGLTADMQATYNIRQYWENGDYEWAELPDYFLLNAKLTQKFKKVGTIEPEIFLQGTNLLDKDYYETNGSEPGLNFLAGITLRM